MTVIIIKCRGVKVLLIILISWGAFSEINGTKAVTGTGPFKKVLICTVSY